MWGGVWDPPVPGGWCEGWTVMGSRFSLPQFEGTWFMKALAANKQMPETMKPKKSFPMTVTALGDGNYEVQLSFL